MGCVWREGMYGLVDLRQVYSCGRYVFHILSKCLFFYYISDTLCMMQHVAPYNWHTLVFLLLCSGILCENDSHCRCICEISVWTDSFLKWPNFGSLKRGQFMHDVRNNYNCFHSGDIRGMHNALENSNWPPNLIWPIVVEWEKSHETFFQRLLKDSEEFACYNMPVWCYILRRIGWYCNKQVISQ